VDREFAARNVVFGIAGRKGEVLEMRRERGIPSEDQMKARLFPTLRQALKAFRGEYPGPGAPAGASAEQ
jgi:hypothetical protein